MEDSVTDLDDDVFGAVYRILLVLWAPSSFAIHVSQLRVVFYFLQRVFGVVPFCSLSTFLVLSVSFEDAVHSHGISGIISLFFLRDSMYILVKYV